MGKKPKKTILLNSGYKSFDLIEDMALEMIVILGNLDKFPDLQTVDDLFEAMDVDEFDRTDFLFAELAKVYMEYDEEEEEEEDDEETVTSALIHQGRVNSHPNALYVEILTKALFVKDKKGAYYRRVVKLGFLKEKFYMPGKSEGVIVLPFLGEVIEDVSKSDFEGIEPYIMNIGSIRNLDTLSTVHRYLVPSNDTEPFICGNTVYSVLLNKLTVHGSVKDMRNNYTPVQRRITI